VTALALCGWLVALVALVRVAALRRRLELVACAEHELRGPLAALTLAARRERPLAPAVIEGQLERARAALADLAAARHGRRAPPSPERHDPHALTERAAAGWTAAGGRIALDWHAGGARVEADPGRLSQALGNLLSNALEHGCGPVTVRGRRAGRMLEIEVANRGSAGGGRPRRAGRGRGLAIASRAAAEAGGNLRVLPAPGETVVALELPLADA
jgi:two-component system, NtrC family, nitrogen regulation sensor histidine kinase GlnL